VGYADEEPRKFDGQITLSAGEVVNLEGWHFDRNDAVLSDTSWRFSTREPIKPRLRPDQIARGQKVPKKQKPIPNGIVVTVSAPPTAVATVTTASGTFSFTLGEVKYGQPLTRLEGNAKIERVPRVERLTGEPTHEDHASVCIAENGDLWVAYLSYQNEADDVYVQRFTQGTWQEPLRLTPQSGDHFKTAIAQAGDGKIWVVWSRREGTNWDLYARSIQNGTLGDLVRLTTAPQPDIYHQMVADGQGRLWLVWQGFREGQADIFLRAYENGRWGEEMRVSEFPANDWEPAVAVDRRGVVYVAWDTYQKGNYDICLRSRAQGTWSPVRFLTANPAFEAHVHLAIDPQDRLWLAWDQSGSNWGKDSGFNPQNAFGFPNPGTRLHAGRFPRLVCLEGGELKEPAQNLRDSFPPGRRWLNEYPQVRFDRSGRLWVFYRRPERKRQSAGGGAVRTWWENYAAYYEGSKWVAEIWIPHTVNRQDLRLAAAPTENGFVLAWTSDERPFRHPVPQYNNLYVARLEADVPRKGLPNLVAYTPPKDTRPPTNHPNEEQDVARRQGARVTVGGRTLRLLCGDTHRHTDISADGGGDGSQYDMYRYALDAIAFDWISIGDHDNGFPLNAPDEPPQPGQDFTWWQTQKACDLFYLPGTFAPLFGYERSNAWPYGHRNVTNWRRGVRVVPRIFDRIKRGNRVVRRLSPRDLQNLYAELRKSGGVTFEHTSGTPGMGTDWRDVEGNLDVEPVVEIYQGCRTSYEYPGAPRAAVPDRPELQAGGFAPEGYVWEAWRKGLRLGVIASSDHGSTHMSYASVWAEDFTRKAIVDAIKQRHTFGATDNIVLIFLMRDPSTGEHFMGEEFTTTTVPVIYVKVLGTAEIRRIDLIRDFKFIDARFPRQQDFEYQYRDQTLTPGDHLYYVRVEQRDGQLAWASPIWVTYRGS